MIRSFCSFYDIDYKGAICKDDFNRDAFRDNVTVKELGYFISKIRYKLHVSNKEIISQYFRINSMKIGGGCNICCNIMTSEPYLIRIGENVTISGNVTFVTHDNSISKVSPQYANLFGYIEIGDNCFVGQNSTIMYGCILANNIIIASGSVVCNSFTE